MPSSGSSLRWWFNQHRQPYFMFLFFPQSCDYHSVDHGLSHNINVITLTVNLATIFVEYEILKRE